MNELVKKLREEAGMTDDQISKAMLILKDYIYGKVPPMFSGVVDKFLKDAFPADKGGKTAPAKEEDILD